MKKETLTNKREKMYLFDPIAIEACDLMGNNLLPYILKTNKLSIDFIHKTIGNVVYFQSPSADDELTIIGKRIFAGQQVKVTESQKEFIIKLALPALKGSHWIVLEGIKKAFVEITDKSFIGNVPVELCGKTKKYSDNQLN